MQKISETTSLCEHCFRHVPATKFERDGEIWLGKTCTHHEYVEHLVEPDGEFYKNYVYPRRVLDTYFIELTNRCNLACPHCYQIPDNKSIDESIEYYVNKVKSWPDDGYNICFAGAEPTVRKDLYDIIKAINAIDMKPRHIYILTNGVNLSKKSYAEQFVEFNNISWTIGLNHPDYQGHTVRHKQEEGMQNCKELGLEIKDVSFTLEGLFQAEDCLKEIINFDKDICNHFRIRVSAEIGRTPGDEKIYLSQLVDHVKELCKKNNWSYETMSELGIRAHYPVLINGIFVKLIQWPDVKTIDLEEMETETWADFLPGKPISPLVHQAILRDASINNGLPLYDTVPEKYRR